MAIVDELRDKLLAKFRFSEDRVDIFVKAIRAQATMVVAPNEQLPKGTVSDPDDLMILECALAAKAHLIICSLSDLLALNPFRGIVFGIQGVEEIFRSDLRQSS